MIRQLFKDRIAEALSTFHGNFQGKAVLFFNDGKNPAQQEITLIKKYAVLFKRIEI
jgi:hypothetical protein